MGLRQKPLHFVREQGAQDISASHELGARSVGEKPAQPTELADRTVHRLCEKTPHCFAAPQRVEAQRESAEHKSHVPLRVDVRVRRDVRAERTQHVEELLRASVAEKCRESLLVQPQRELIRLPKAILYGPLEHELDLSDTNLEDHLLRLLINAEQREAHVVHFDENAARFVRR